MYNVHNITQNYLTDKSQEKEMLLSFKERQLIDVNPKMTQMLALSDMYSKVSVSKVKGFYRCN